MKVNAAISFILCGTSLALLTRKEISGWTLSASGLAAGFTVAIALLTLAEYGFDWNSSIDQLFFTEPQGMSFTASPGRMAVIAAVMYLLQGVSLLLMVQSRYHAAIQVLALISGLIALLPIGGYMFGNLLFPKIGHSSGIAAHAALGLLAMSIGILLATSNRGFIAAFQPRMRVINTVLSLAILVISIIAMLHSIDQSRKASDSVDEAYLLLKREEKIKAALFEHKAINRSYLLTDNESLVEQQFKLRKTIFDGLKELKTIVTGNPLQEQRLDLLEPMFKSLFVLADQLVKARREGGVFGAVGLVSYGEADRLHSAIIAKLDEIDAAEQRLLDERKKMAELKTSIAKVTLATTLLIGIALLWDIFKALRREISQREQAEREEKARSYVLGLIARSTPLAETLEAIVRNVEQQYQQMHCSILLLDQAGSHLLFGAAPNLPDFYNKAIHGIEIGAGVGSCGTAAFTGERVVVEDIQTHPYWTPYKELAAKAGLRSCWSEPIRSSQGKVVGTFAIYHSDIHAPNEENLALIEETANLASIAIEKHIVESELERDKFLRDQALDLAQAGHWSIDFSESDQYYIYSERTAEIFGAPYREGFRYHILNDWYVNLEAADKELADATLANYLAAVDGTVPQYDMIHPYKRPCDGRIVWVHVLGHVIRDHHGKPTHVYGVAMDVTQQKLFEKELERRAHIDYLTGLNNRGHFMHKAELELARAIRYENDLSILMLDIDHFKQINDTQGHKTGDLVLKELADACRMTLREVDVIGRLGGEEFAILLPETEKEEAIEVAERLRESIALVKIPLESGQPISFTVSIGISSLTSTDNNLDVLLNLADKGLYAAKSSGRNTVSVVDQ